MLYWFGRGFFHPIDLDLLLRREGIDTCFMRLEEMKNLYGRVPFLPGPTPGPLLHEQVFK